MLTTIKKFSGLSSEEAQIKLRQWGPNEIKDVNKTSPLKLIIHQLKKNAIIYLLLVAAVLSFFVGEAVTGYTILLVIFMVVTITFIQEYKAEKAIQALKEMIHPVSIVVRDGKEKEAMSTDLVPDDLLVLRVGEKIPADCILVEESNIKLNEAILTGEAREVKKTVPKDPKKATEENILYMGTYVVEGRGLALITHTGMNTRFGKIVSLISQAEKELPLQNKVNKIARYLVGVAIIAALATGLLILVRTPEVNSEILTQTLILMIAIAVASFPEGLPVVLMTSLAVGAKRMADKNAIINRMSIIETLGETTVICSDKTGTITKGEMTIKKILTPDKVIDISGAGFEASGDFLYRDKKIEIDRHPDLKLLFQGAVLCNDSQIERTGEDGIYQAIGSPTEAALLIMAAKAKIFREDLSFTRKEEIPFNSQRKMMSVLYQSDSGERVFFSKGAPEILLEKCDFVEKDGKKLNFTKKEKEEILNQSSSLAKQAFRTLALAYRPAKSEKDVKEGELIFLGVVAMEDPPREEIRETLEICKTAGIEVKMITGDHKETALAVAERIGLEGDVLEGDDLNRMTDDELGRVIKNVAIFARVKPEHKLRIVRVLKSLGEIVTMTGDGVNDAPALKESQIGVVMGKSGTDVARSVADLTLRDDNFVTIVEAVREGRTIFNNIRKFVSYKLSCNFAELTVLFFGVLLAPIFGWQIPILLALQILFMNLVTDDLPAITLAFNASSKDVMQEEPRRKAEILIRSHIVLIVVMGFLMALGTLGLYFLSFNILDQGLEVARTTALVVLILLEIVVAFQFRSFRRRVFNRSPFSNIYLFFAAIISLLATILIIYTPLNHVFETAPLGLATWGGAIVVALLIVAFSDYLKELNNRKQFLDFNTSSLPIKSLYRPDNLPA